MNSNTNLRIKFKKKCLPILMTIIVFGFGLRLVYCWKMAEMGSTTTVTWPEQSQNDSSVIEKAKLKNILLWNSPGRIEVAIFGVGHEPFITAGCPVNQCRIEARNASMSPDNKWFQSFDAVLISMSELWFSSMPAASGYVRPAHQRLVWLTQESPQSMVAVNPADYDNVFNWTMSYKKDSDIQLLYGRVEPIAPCCKTDAQFKRELAVKISRKTGKVVWMVSHCPTPSRREKYVQQLQQFIPIDIYGWCGNLSCPKDDGKTVSSPECYDMISRKYKFYLSFENTLCTDYVTEKFFSILQRDLVPIVLGGADYESVAPPHSFINALDFSGPEKLAEYLHLLDNNDALYSEYFAWKSSYRVEAGVEQMARHAFCDLCAKLHEPITTHIYPSMATAGWSKETQCRQWD